MSHRSFIVKGPSELRDVLYVQVICLPPLPWYVALAAVFELALSDMHGFAHLTVWHCIRMLITSVYIRCKLCLIGEHDYAICCVTLALFCGTGYDVFGISSIIHNIRLGRRYGV